MVEADPACTGFQAAPAGIGAGTFLHLKDRKASSTSEEAGLAVVAAGTGTDIQITVPTFTRKGTAGVSGSGAGA